MTSLWVLRALDGAYWTDDRGGNLFVSEAQAEACLKRHKLEAICQVLPCGLDEDLAQMGDLYHE